MADSNVRIVINAEDRASGVLSGVSGALGNVLTTATGFLTARVFEKITEGVVAFGRAVISESIEAQEVQAQLLQVLKTTGEAAGISADEANDLADSLSRVTRFSDEAILSAETLLLGFTNIGEDVFPRVTEMATDLATRFGIDLENAARLLGKALEDPAEGLSALARYGVRFSDEQQAIIKSMVDAGDAAGAQAYMLAELEKSYGGAAQAAGKTFAGQMDIVKNQLLNVAEGIGLTLLPVAQQFISEFLIPALPAIQAFGEAVSEYLVNTLFPALQSFGAWFSENREVILSVLAGIASGLAAFVIISSVVSWITGLIAAISAAGAAIGAAGGIVSAIIAVLGGPLTIAIAAVALVVGLLAAAWTNNWGDIQGKTQAVIDYVKPLIANALAAITAWWDEHGESVMTIVTTLWDTARETIASAISIISSVVSTVLTAIQGFWSQHGEAILAFITRNWENIKEQFSLATEFIGNLIDAFAALITGDFETFGEEMEAAAINLWDMVKNAFETGKQNVIDLVSALIEAVKNFFADTDWGAIGAGIIAGIAAGITAGASVIRNAALAAAQAALAAVKEFLGIESPSRVFAGIGMNMMAGMAQGIDQAAGMPAGSITAAAGQVINNWNLTINSSGVEDPVRRFGMMQAFARG